MSDIRPLIGLAACSSDTGSGPDLGGGALLRPDVDVRGGIVADQHRRQSHVAELGDVGCDPLPHALGERSPVHERGGHGPKG